MATNGEAETHHTGIIGNKKNFWLYDSRTGFDLTHPESPNAPKILPRIHVETTTEPIAIDPEKTALVIIDMQNFFLSDVLGKKRGAGHDACDQLVQYAIPAARKAGIRVVWVNWGLTEQEIEDMPPAVLRCFGFEGQRGDENVPVDKHGQVGGYKGMGREMGAFKDPKTGKEVDAGRLLMRDQWNTALLPPLDEMYEEGKKLKSKPDVWIHKNRMSGIWTQTALSDFLIQENIKTIFFTGVNTDQCVAGTYQDCFSKGFDSILLNDGCGTTSPDFAQKEVEFNAAHSWGFETKCKAFAEGVDKMEK